VTDSAIQTWQRPPFEPGNTLAMTHGADSKRADVVAEHFYTRLMAAESTPQWLQDPSYEDAIRAYCRTLALIKLLWDWCAAQDIETAMTDLTTEDETEVRTYGSDRESGEQDGKKGSKRKTARRTTSRHVGSVLSRLDRLETRAMHLRSSLGLDPRSRAQIGRDVTAARFDLAQAIAALAQQQERSG
jgi:hypothetical protein